jgi:hypothetical protein
MPAEMHHSGGLSEQDRTEILHESFALPDRSSAELVGLLNKWAVEANQLSKNGLIDEAKDMTLRINNLKDILNHRPDVISDRKGKYHLKTFH